MPKSTFYNLQQEKREKIINAAIDEFAENNYYKAKITNIIKIAEIASGSFYQYFDGKDDLYKYLIDIILKRKLKYLDQQALSQPDELSFFELLRKLYKSGIEFAKENPKLVSIGNYMMNGNCPVCNEILKDQKPQGELFFKKLIEKAKQDKEIKEEVDPNFTAKFLTSINYSLGDFIYEDDGINDNIMDTIDVLLNIIENGIKDRKGES
ncbi:MAG: TetR/AcrR family transcriptional regulator [Halanaerobiales bacterium]|nr:TetR/AcrR family transcriptional regulator [Halanaerobiales bacterium]